MNEIKEKAKVLFVMQMPPPVHGASIMGKYIRDSELINSNFECHYINPSMAKDVGDLAKISFRKILLFPKLLYNITKVVKRTKPDLCYFTPASGKKGFYKSFLIVTWLKVLNQKIVLHFHNKGISRRKSDLLDSFLFKSFFKEVKLIILSSYLYPEFEEYVDFDNVSICANGIPSSVSERKWIEKKDKFNMLFLSNMIAEKGVWLLLESCKLLKDKGYIFECNFVGKWSMIQEKDFNEKVEVYGLGGFVRAHGAKYGNDKREYFEKADIFIFPTFYENETFGLVLLEAMEYGIPCISTYEGGIPDVVENGKTGILIKEKNANMLASEISHLMNNEDLRLELGKNGRKAFKEKFTLKKFEKRMVNILRTYIEEK